MLDVEALVLQATEQLASDVHITVGEPPIFRRDGVLYEQDHPPITSEEALDAVRQLASDEQMEEFRREGEADFAVTLAGRVRMRCNIYHQRNEAALALRLLPLEIPTPESLHLPEIVVRQASKPRGMLLVTGPTGSGKSSTLAALISHINHTQRRHIITLEQPIEYLHTGDLCMINQREVGQDTKSFASGLRAALRQDPDVILVGEMRDLETISTAITAAETGHLVFGTLHTKGAPNTVDRIIDAFPPEQQNQVRIQLADVLECVVGQTLLPTLRGGRRAAFEVLVATPAVRGMILQGKTQQLSNTMLTSRREGMRLLDDELLDLVGKGEISADVAIAASNAPDTMRTRLELR